MMTTSTSQSQELAMDTLESMILQESGAYRIPTSHLEAILNDDDSVTSQRQPGKRQAELSSYLAWRRQMVQWCYSISDTCKFSKETVEITTSLLDRYVATCPKTMLDADYYQLSCMACFYTACKMNEPTCLSPEQMERISGCRFDNQALQMAEVKILKALQWRVNPPTAIAFARSLLDSADLQREFGVYPQQKEAILFAVGLQIEQATADELFIPIRASGIALAAVLNASQNHLPRSKHLKFQAVMSRAMGYEIETSSYQRHQKIEKLQHALLALVAMSQGQALLYPLVKEAHDGEYYEPVKSTSFANGDYRRSHSPRSVTTSKQ